jgi:hypothetical protein
MARAIFGDDIVLPKTSGSGIRVDTASPTFGWADIIGQIRPDPAGVDAPVLATYRGTARDYAYDTSDKIDMIFHVPHDYLPNSDMFLHLHWSHIGTAISGSLVVSNHTTYAKGHNQAEFPTSVDAAITVSTPNIATVPQYRHRVDEVQLTAASPSGSQIATSLIEVDGVFIISLIVTTKPTITGGTTNDPFIHTLDIHYQTTGVSGTKAKAPNFYV